MVKSLFLIQSFTLLLLLLLLSAPVLQAEEKEIVVNVHADKIEAVAVNSAETLIATAGDDTMIQLWDGSLKHVGILAGHTAEVKQLEFSADGTHLVSLDLEGNVKIWNCLSRTLESSTEYGTAVLGVNFCQNSNSILNVLIVDKAKEGDTTYESGPTSYAVTGAKQLVFVSGEDRVAFQKPSTANKFDLSRTAMIAWGGEDGSVSLFHPLKKQSRILTRFSGPVEYVRLSSDGSVIAAMCKTNDVQIWKLDKTDTKELKPTISQHIDPEVPLVLSDDGSFAYCGDTMFDINKKQVEKPKESGHFMSDTVWNTVLVKKGKVLLSVYGPCLLKTSFETGKAETDEYVSNLNSVRHLAYHSKKNILAVSSSMNYRSGGDLHLIDTRNFKQIHNLPGQNSQLGFNTDGTILAVLSSDKVHLWDIDQGFKTISEKKGEFQPLPALWKNQCAFKQANDSALIWDFEKNTNTTVEKIPESLQAFCLSKNLQSIAFMSSDFTAKNARFTLMEVNGGKSLRDIALPGTKDGYGNYFMTMSPDGRWLAYSFEEGKTACVVDLTDPSRHHKISGHTGSVPCLAFNPSGTLFASGGRDGTIQIWDCVSWTPKYAIKAHNAPVADLVFEDDLLISGAWDGVVRFWNPAEGKMTKSIFIYSDSRSAASDRFQ